MAMKTKRYASSKRKVPETFPTQEVRSGPIKPGAEPGKSAKQALVDKGKLNVAPKQGSE